MLKFQCYENKFESCSYSLVQGDRQIVGEAIRRGESCGFSLSMSDVKFLSSTSVILVLLLHQWWWLMRNIMGNDASVNYSESERDTIFCSCNLTSCYIQCVRNSEDGKKANSVVAMPYTKIPNPDVGIISGGSLTQLWISRIFSPLSSCQARVI